MTPGIRSAGTCTLPSTPTGSGTSVEHSPGAVSIDMAVPDTADAATWLAAARQDVTDGAGAATCTPNTALRALATSDNFVAAICVSAIVDLERYRQRTHKFQRHETDLLIGPFPREAELYRQRSPASLVGSINRPVLFVHGNSDPIAPVEAVETIAHALDADRRQQALFFEHEGHPVGQSKNRIALLIAAAHFLEDVLPSQHGQK